MKSKIIGIIAILALIGFALTTCDSSNDSGDDLSSGNSELVFFHVDADGEFSETDMGRTVVLADSGATVVFYSDNIMSDAQHVGFAFGENTIVFLFENRRHP